MDCLQIPTLTAGFSATIKAQTSSEYPSTAFTLNIVFRNQQTGAKQTFQFSPDGLTNWVLNLTPANTTAIGAGQRTVVSYITDDETGGTATKIVIAEQIVTVGADPTDSTATDRRSFYRRMVDTLRATLEGLASGKLSSTSVNGKSYTNRNLAEVREELARFESLLAAEERAFCGKSNSKQVLVRFGTPH